MKTSLIIFCFIYFISCASQPKRTWSLEATYPEPDTIRCTYKGQLVYQWTLRADSVYHFYMTDFGLFEKCVDEFIQPLSALEQFKKQ